MSVKTLSLIGATVILVAIGGVVSLKHVHKAKPAGAARTGLVVALGDSVAAGYGLETDADASACGRTQESYPKLVADSLGHNLTSYACSGAQTSVGVLSSQTVNQLAETPQLAALLAGPRPSVVTVTTGANDIGWTQLLATCYTAVCGTPSDTAITARNISTASGNLGSVVAQIKSHYGSSVPIVVTGYYRVFPQTNPGCSDLTGIDNNELAWFSAREDDLNAALAQAAVAAGAQFAAIDFSGHELCSGSSWIQGVGATGAYHPTDQGQQAIAKSVESALKTASASH